MKKAMEVKIEQAINQFQLDSGYDVLVLNIKKVGLLDTFKVEVVVEKKP